jgi:hypothetical protein
VLNQDYHDMLTALVHHDVRFLVVGAHALAAHGYPRATVDIDIWIDATADNAHRVWQALSGFGAPLKDLSIKESDFARADIVAQFGLPPNRIDILTGVTGLDFEHAWANRIPATLEGVQVSVLGRADLITNKRATGREKDRFDVRGLEGKS